jgi:hypothetical protein
MIVSGNSAGIVASTYSNDDLYSYSKIAGLARIVSPAGKPDVEIVCCLVGIGAQNVSVLRKSESKAGHKSMIPAGKTAHWTPCSSHALQARFSRLVTRTKHFGGSTSSCSEVS